MLSAGLGFFLLWNFPADGANRILIALPPWLAGAVCIWIPLRRLGMYVRIGPEGIAAAQYFRTVTVRWEDILTLIEQEHRVLVMGGIVSTGTVYTVYSKADAIRFTSRLQAAEELADVISRATALPWKSGSRIR